MRKYFLFLKKPPITLWENSLIIAVMFCLPLITCSLFMEPYTVIKWKLVHLFALVTTFHLFFIRKEILVPSLSRETILCLGAIFLLWGWEYYFHGIPILSHVTVDRLAFLLLLVFFSHIFRERPEVIDIMATTLIWTMGIFILLLLKQNPNLLQELFSLKPIQKKIQFTFGNENMAAQFFGVVSFAALRHFLKPKPLLQHSLWGLLSALFLWFVWKSSCRSIMLGLFAGLSTYLCLRSQDPWRKRLLITLPLLGIGLTTLILLIRQETIQHRLEMWHHAFEIAKDHPLGIGRDRFGFHEVLYKQSTNLMPASEKVIQRTPHSEPLKYLAEEGWLFVALCLLLLFYFLKDHGPPLLKVLQKNERLLFSLGLLALFIPEFLLQFPLEVAFGFMMIITSLGFILSTLSKHQTFYIPLALKVIIFTGFLGGSLCLVVAELGSGYFKRDMFITELGCRLAPFEWRTCDYFKEALDREEKPWVVIHVALKDLEKRPYQFTALTHLARSYYRENQLQKACKVAWFYDRLFHHKSMLTPFVVRQCPQEQQKKYLNFPLREHYFRIFDHLPQEWQERLNLRRIS